MAAVSPAAVRRRLAKDAIKPWQYRSWIFPRDPNFAAKAGRVLGLYERRWQGRDSQLQALARRHPGRSPAPGRARRVEFEYTPGGLQRRLRRAPG